MADNKMNIEHNDKNNVLVAELDELKKELARWKLYAQCYTVPQGRCSRCNTPLNRGYICCSCGTDPTVK